MRNSKYQLLLWLNIMIRAEVIFQVSAYFSVFFTTHYSDPCQFLFVILQAYVFSTFFWCGNLCVSGGGWVWVSGHFPYTIPDILHMLVKVFIYVHRPYPCELHAITHPSIVVWVLGEEGVGGSLIRPMSNIFWMFTHSIFKISFWAITFIYYLFGCPHSFLCA